MTALTHPDAIAPPWRSALAGAPLCCPAHFQPHPDRRPAFRVRSADFACDAKLIILATPALVRVRLVIVGREVEDDGELDPEATVLEVWCRRHHGAVLFELRRLSV